MRGPKGLGALKSEESDASIFGAGMHENVQVDLLELVVVANGARKRH